jgi:hypothetical protein
MKNLSPRSDAVSATGRAAHDIGAAALLGGNLFGRLAMHPALREAGSNEDRGRIVNAAWRRYGTVNSLALAAVVSGWVGARSYEAKNELLSDRERSLARARDVAVGAVAVTGIAAAVTGVRFGHAAPGGAVPLASGSKPAPETPHGAAQTKRALNALGALNIAAEATLVAVNAALSQQNFRRPPARRFLKRRFG